LLPTVRRDSDFYLGGLFTLLVSAFFIVLFALLLANAQTVRSFALNKSTAVTVSLDDTLFDSKDPSDSTMPVPIKKPPADSKPQERATTPKDISSLFSDVKTEKITHTTKDVKPQEVETKRLSSLQNRLKAIKDRKSTLTSQKVAQMKLVEPSKANKGASSGEEVDRYRASIQATIYNHFYPPSGSQGLVAKVQITISATGKMVGFKILRYSGDAVFDEEIRALKQRLSSVEFALNPDGVVATLNVRLISKE